MKKLRAIYIKDTVSPKIHVYEYNKNNDKFQMIGYEGINIERKNLIKSDNWMIFEIIYEKEVENSNVKIIDNSLLSDEEYLREFK